MNDTETLIFCKTFYQAIAKSPGKTVNWFLDIKDHIDEPRLLKLAVEGGIPEVIFLACYNGKTSDLYRKLTDAFDKDVLELFGNGIASVGSYPKKPIGQNKDAKRAFVERVAEWKLRRFQALKIDKLNVENFDFIVKKILPIATLDIWKAYELFFLRSETKAYELYFAHPAVYIPDRYRNEFIRLLKAHKKASSKPKSPKEKKKVSPEIKALFSGSPTQVIQKLFAIHDAKKILEIEPIIKKQTKYLTIYYLFIIISANKPDETLNDVRNNAKSFLLALHPQKVEDIFKNLDFGTKIRLVDGLIRNKLFIDPWRNYLYGLFAYEVRRDAGRFASETVPLVIRTPLIDDLAGNASLWDSASEFQIQKLVSALWDAMNRKDFYDYLERIVSFCKTSRFDLQVRLLLREIINRWLYFEISEERIIENYAKLMTIIDDSILVNQILINAVIKLKSKMKGQTNESKI